MEGLKAIFEYIGGVPSEIWFDNTRTIVTEIIKGGGRTIVERFQRFANTTVSCKKMYKDINDENEVLYRFYSVQRK